MEGTERPLSRSLQTGVWGLHTVLGQNYSSIPYKFQTKMISNSERKGINSQTKTFQYVEASHDCVEDLIQPFRADTVDEAAGIDAMGFILGLRVLLVDQWVETGGAVQAAIHLVERQGGIVAGIAAICIEDSEGGQRLKERYKWARCVPPELMAQFNAHCLDSAESK